MSNGDAGANGLEGFLPLSLGERYRAMYRDWVERVQVLHHDFQVRENEAVAWTPLPRALSDCRLALVSTAGVHRREDPPFDTLAPEGDWSYRVIPALTRSPDLMVSHGHYDHSDADQDINCVFPIDRLRELEAEGSIGALSQVHFGFMGFNPNPESILKSAREVAGTLHANEVDVVFLTPG